VLNFLESGGIRESYFFNHLEALLNAQILKFWLLPHCPHQAQSRYKFVSGFLFSRRSKFTLLSIENKNAIKALLLLGLYPPSAVWFAVAGIIGISEANTKKRKLAFKVLKK